MSVSYGKGPRGKATRLHSLIVRAIGYCERCGTPCPCENAPRSHTTSCPLECSHIIGRRYSNTRTDLANAIALCKSCHRQWEEGLLDREALVREVQGAGVYGDLREKARSTAKVDWVAEAQRLELIARERGVL